MHDSNYLAVDSTSIAPSATVGRIFIMLNAALALVLTVVCSLRIYKALDRPALTGIDDENITQVYGQNLAHGFGYVYTPNFEHVEGATSPLWVALHWLLYSITDRPEPFILICSAVCTALAIFWGLEIARSLANALALPRWSLWIPVVAIAAQPNYFHWTVITMMDQAVWGALVVGLTHVLIRESGSARWSMLGVCLCALSVLARPESMLLMPSMLVIAAVVVAVNRSNATAIRYIAPYVGAFFLTLAALTVARVQYFGYPFPNTYYAKVSSNPVDNIVQGLHYAIGFLHSNVLAVPFVLAVVLAVLIGAPALWSSPRSKTPLSPAQSIALLLGGTLSVMFATLVLEGGDHFPGFRMVQPYVPLLAVTLLFYVPLLAGWSRLAVSRTAGVTWCAAIVAAALLSSYSAFAAANKGLIEDFDLAVDGRRMGYMLNTLGDLGAEVGVLPAGGIAVTYRGRVLDLLGLNWSQMAHASGRRTGVVGHSGFNLEVFWKHPPELMLPELTKHTGPHNLKGTPANFELAVLQGLMNEQRFREEYSPVLIHVGNSTLFAYARESFVHRHQGDERINVLSWQQLRDPAPEAAGRTS